MSKKALGHSVCYLYCVRHGGQRKKMRLWRKALLTSRRAGGRGKLWRLRSRRTPISIDMLAIGGGEYDMSPGGDGVLTSRMVNTPAGRRFSNGVSLAWWRQIAYILGGVRLVILWRSGGGEQSDDYVAGSVSSRHQFKLS